MNKKKVSIVLISGFLLLGAGQLSVEATSNSPPDTYWSSSLGNNSDGSNSPSSLSELLGGISDGLDDVEKFFSEGIGEIGGAINQVVGIIQGVTSPVQSIFTDVSKMVNLVVRLINFPSQLGGWWDTLLNTVTGELDPCLSAPSVGTTPPFTYEPGWCIGGRGVVLDGDGDSDGGNGSDDGGLLPHEGGDPTAPAGRKSLGEVLKSSKGAAGVPIPSEVRSAIRQSVDQLKGGDLFEANPTVIGLYRGNAAERGMARVASELVLGEVGQEKMKAEQQGIQETVTTSFKTAGAAQSLNVTQDIVKQMVQMQAQETMLTGSLASSSQQERIDRALSLLNESNISRALDEANRGRRIDRSVAAMKVLRSSAQSNLF